MAAKTAIVIELSAGNTSADALWPGWLGLYQMNGKGLGPDWGRCVEGDAPSFTNWREGQPDDYHGYTKRTARVSRRLSDLFGAVATGTQG